MMNMMFGPRLKARSVAILGMVTVLIALGSGLLAFDSASNFPADRECGENPTVACVAEIAAQSARALDRSTQWEQILNKLAAAGRADVAEELAYRLPSKWSLEQHIAVQRIVAAIRSSRSAAEALEALSTLGTDGRRIYTTLYFVALDLAGEQPYTRGGTTWLVAAEKAYASSHRMACSATLQALLQHWSEIIDTDSSPSLFDGRTKLADAYSLCGDKQAAVRTLGMIDPSELAKKKDSLYLTPLVRSWVQAGKLDRALAVATLQPDPKSELRSYLEVARSYVAEGRHEDALAVVSNASHGLKKVTRWWDKLEIRAGLIDVERQAGDSADALRHTEELASLAERPDPFRPFSLIRVATLFNDMNRPDRAIETLEKAVDLIPPSDRIVAIGHVAGPIRYERSGLEGEALQDAGVQLYRAGRKAKAIDVIRRADPLHRRRAAIEVVRSKPADSPVDPEVIAEEFGSDNPGELLLVAAGKRIEFGDIQGAATYFERFARGPAPHHENVEECSVRVAVMLKKPEYLAVALKRGLRYADSMSDANRRVILLSSLAAAANARLQ